MSAGPALAWGKGAGVRGGFAPGCGTGPALNLEGYPGFEYYVGVCGEQHSRPPNPPYTLSKEPISTVPGHEDDFACRWRGGLRSGYPTSTLRARSSHINTYVSISDLLDADD